MKPVHHDDSGSALIRVSAKFARELWVSRLAVEDLREQVDSYDPLWGLREGDLEESSWDEGTVYCCSSELAAQLLAAFEEWHGYSTFGLHHDRDRGEDYLVISTRRRS